MEREYCQHVSDDDEYCTPSASAECFSCIFGISDIDMDMFGDFLVSYKAKMRQTGMSIHGVDAIIEAVSR